MKFNHLVFLAAFAGSEYASAIQDFSSKFEEKEVFHGYLGSWKGWKGGNGYACGADMKYEDKKEVGDDVGGTGIILKFCDYNDWSKQTDVTLFSGKPGDWKGMKMCSKNFYVDGAQAQVDSVKGARDYTAMNGLKVRCRDKASTSTEWITVHTGDWGEWEDQITDSERYVKEGQVRYEDPLRWGDDTALNGLSFRFEVAETPSPTKTPTTKPTADPTKDPTASPTKDPTASPKTASPTKDPTGSPTKDPTASPTKDPTASPKTGSPTKDPTVSPTKDPTVSPTKDPTALPTIDPTASPTVNPPSDVYKPGYSCEGKNQKKNLGTGFKTPQECLAAALKTSGCGPTIMWSKSYNYSWGCRCCVPGATYTKHNLWSIYQAEGDNISKGKVATQSSTCYGGLAARAVDGNTDGVYAHKSVTHTCKKPMNTWSVSVGPSIITKIVIWNRTDSCCTGRIKGAKLDIINGGKVVTSRNISTNTRSYTFDFGSVEGSVVKVSLANEFLSLAEVQVYGFASSSPIVNISKGKVATQSSTCYGGVAARAVDGNTSGVWQHNSVSHTCKGAMNTWSVTVGLSVITKIVIWNRTDCCAERIKGAKLDIFNGGKLVASRSIASTTRSYTFDFGNVIGSVVKVSLANQYLSLAEVQVFGFATTGPKPTPVPPQPTKPATQCTFVFHPYMDSNGNDIGRYSGGVNNYKKICLANPKCTCFNSNGWVKYITKPKNQWSKWTNNKNLGLYVKTCTKPTPVPPSKPAPTTPSKPVNKPSGASKPGYSCEGANQKKNLGTGFKTPQQCLTAALKTSGCGPSIMWSKSYNYAWGCRCCVAGATYTKHNNWDIYGTVGSKKPTCSFRAKYIRKWPNCANIKCTSQNTSKASMESMCRSYSECTGFSFTTGANSGWGCLKKCGSKEFGGYGATTHDYWVKECSS